MKRGEGVYIQGFKSVFLRDVITAVGYFWMIPREENKGGEQLTRLHDETISTVENNLYRGLFDFILLINQIITIKWSKM